MRAENWPRDLHGGGCGCSRCRRRSTIDRLADQSLSTALRHAQSRAEADFGEEAASPPGRVTLPGSFSGWKRPVTLAELFADPPPAPYGATAFPALYRIYAEGTQIPLYVGMVLKTSIAARVASHVRRLITRHGAPAKTAQVKAIAATSPADFQRKRSEIARLRVLVAQIAGARRVKVQFGTVELDGGRRPDPKLLHAYEAALQVIERPRAYVGGVWTFEDVT